MVNERILYFNSEDAYKGWQLETEIVEIDADHVIVKATIINDLGQVVRTGHAHEFTNDTPINKISFLEVCETSAVGRALAFLGIGVEESIASAEEVSHAIKQQGDKPWLEHKDFDAVIRELNETPDDSERQGIYHKLDVTYKMKKDYRSQLLEVVKQRDINV